VGIAVADLVIREIWAAGLAAWALWFVWHGTLLKTIYLTVISFAVISNHEVTIDILIIKRNSPSLHGGCFQSVLLTLSAVKNDY